MYGVAPSSATEVVARTRTAPPITVSESSEDRRPARVFGILALMSVTPTKTTWPQMRAQSGADSADPAPPRRGGLTIAEKIAQIASWWCSERF